MNPMRDIYVRAVNGGLSIGTHRDYFASEEFAERIKFQGEQGKADQVAMTVYMLKRVALSPFNVAEGRRWLDKGVVNLTFFGWSNPVTMLSLDGVEDAQDLDRIREAFRANFEGPLYAAALRVIAWRSRYGKGEKAREKIVRRMRNDMQWPTGRDDEAREEASRMAALLDAKADALRSLRHERLARLTDAAGPKARSWTEFLESMAQAALMPKSETALL